MNRKQQGDVGVAMAIAHYTRCGYIVSVPLTDNARYDLLVDSGRTIRRIQVKTTGYLRKGAYEVHTKTCGGNQSWQHASRYITEDECDAVFIFALNGSIYELPVSLVAGKGSIKLGPVVEGYRLPSLAEPMPS